MLMLLVHICDGCCDSAAQQHLQFMTLCCAILTPHHFFGQLNVLSPAGAMCPYPTTRNKTPLFKCQGEWSIERQQLVAPCENSPEVSSTPRSFRRNGAGEEMHIHVHPQTFGFVKLCAHLMSEWA